MADVRRDTRARTSGPASQRHAGRWSAKQRVEWPATPAVGFAGSRSRAGIRDGPSRRKGAGCRRHASSSSIQPRAVNRRTRAETCQRIGRHRRRDLRHNATRGGGRRNSELNGRQRRRWVLLAVGRGRGSATARVDGRALYLAIIDTPPRAGSDNAAQVAARVADLVLLPCRPSVLDVEAVADTAARVRAVTAAPVVAVLNGCAPRGQDADQVAAALAGVDVQVAPVPDRSAHSACSVATHRPGRAGKRAGRARRSGSRRRACVHRVHTRTARTLEHHQGGSMSTANNYAAALPLGGKRRRCADGSRPLPQRELGAADRRHPGAESAAIVAAHAAGEALATIRAGRQSRVHLRDGERLRG